MSVSVEQREFNKYPVKAFKPDIWFGLPKQDKRLSTIALTYSFLLQGGRITKAPAKKRKDGRPDIFGKDTRAVKSHEHWNKKFYSGDDFTQKAPRFTSKALPENSAAKRDIERKAGISHAAFTGSVIDISGKLQARKESHATSEAYIDLVSDEALRASAKRGDRHAHKIVTLIEDGCDNVTDAYRAATIRDDFCRNRSATARSDRATAGEYHQGRRLRLHADVMTMPLSRLEILCELNVSTCWCNDCIWSRADALADALEIGGVIALHDGGDIITSLRITPIGRSRMAPTLPWSTA